MLIDPSHDKLPPHYLDFPADPLAFSVGSESTALLVNITEVQAHLRLLAAINKLKSDVQNASTAHPGMDANRAWVVFVNKAVYRFDKFMGGKWTESFPSWSEGAIPPLDVIMVWHTFLLNPRTYYEDSIRRTSPFARRLAAMESMPLTLVASLIDPVTLEPALPSSQRESFFERTSGLPFMFTLVTPTSDTLSLACPCCNEINNTVPWINSYTVKDGEGKGFADPYFEHICERCSRKFTRSMIGVRKFADEMTRRRAKSRVYFSETLLDPMIGKEDSMLADMLNIRLVRRINSICKLTKGCDRDKIIEEATNLARALEWSIQELSVLIHQGLRPRKHYHVYDPPLPRVQRIIAAYSNAGYASIDLVAAVLRQGSFIEKMRDLGWLEQRRFEANQSQGPLFRSIARYHAFLDLMAAKGASFLVPTLDIDLAWHTHQLSGAAYRADTLRLLKRTPNHEDTVQPGTIQTGYDQTAAAWKERFGVPYSVCGCMPDDARGSTKSQSLKASLSSNVETKKGGGLFKLLKSRNSTQPFVIQSPTSSVSTQEMADIPRTELVADDIGDVDASHPSEHNLRLEKTPVKVELDTGKGEPTAISVESDFISRELASKGRMQVIKQAGANDEKEGKKRKSIPIDEWMKIQAERKETRVDHREAFTKQDELAGIYYPYWGVNAAVSFGFYGAFKYADAAGGCGSGCASCGAAPGMCLGYAPVGGTGCAG